MDKHAEKYFRRMLDELRVQLLDAWDKNFERKAFFGKKWKKRKFKGRGSLMHVTGRLRRSIRGRVVGKDVIEFSSDTPYAKIHNEGGEITVTEKMKRYFWYKYYATQQKEYLYMAIKKRGTKISIPQRQFIGYYQGIDKTVERAAGRMVEEAMNEMIERDNRRRR